MATDFNRLYVENDRFYHNLGNVYCVAKSCEGCPHASYCEHEDSEADYNTTPSIRNIICTDNSMDGYSPAPTDINSKANYSHGTFTGDFIPYANTRVYKKITKHPQPYENGEISHIVYNRPDDSYYCIRQRCSKCEHRDLCRPELIIKSAKDIVAVLDAAAQEPRSFTLTTKLTNNLESNWVDIFYNDSIRKLEMPYNSFKLLLDRHGIATDTHEFYKQINELYFHDKTELYLLQARINCYYKLDTPQAKQDFLDIANQILAHFNKSFSFSDEGLQKYILRCVMPFKEQFPPLGDFHAANAIAFYGYDKLKKVYDTDYKTYKSKYRDVAKANALALCYGGGPYNLMNSIGISEPEARAIYSNFYRILNGFGKHLEVTKKAASKSLVTFNLLGRRISLDALASDDRKVKSAGMRYLHNYPIQSTGCDMIKLALNYIYNFSEENETNVWAEDNIHESYYNRVVAIDKSKLTPELEQQLLSLPEGNIKIVVKDGDVWTHTLPQPKAVTHSDIKTLGLELVF